MLRYRIHDSCFIFILDQQGSSFQSIVVPGLRKGIGKKDLYLKAIRAKVGYIRVTIMHAVSATGIAYKPAILFPGKHAHYGVENGVLRIVQSLLPPC